MNEGQLISRTVSGSIIPHIQIFPWISGCCVWHTPIAKLPYCLFTSIIHSAYEYHLLMSDITYPWLPRVAGYLSNRWHGLLQLFNNLVLQTFLCRTLFIPLVWYSHMIVLISVSFTNLSLQNSIRSSSLIQSHDSVDLS
jgi:hypothetical protein